MYIDFVKSMFVMIFIGIGLGIFIYMVGFIIFIVDFMLDVCVLVGGWKEEERKREVVMEK